MTRRDDRRAETATPPSTGDLNRGGHATAPLLSARDLRLRFGRIAALDGVDLDTWPGEVVAIVGESGSGKTTLLRVLSGLMPPDAGSVAFDGQDVLGMTEAARRNLMRTQWGFVHQNPRDGLRMGVSAGGNIGERLMAVGARHYGNIREAAAEWLARVEIDPDRMDALPRTFSGGMQQRLQIARTLVTHPRLVFMDEPTGGLDVSVQARLLDLIRALVAELGLAVLLVTHDIAAARLLAHRILVMRQGQVVEQGLTDRVLDDPQHPYTQLLVASVLAA
jgi:putative phosphonate transport system ATP-binding protein